MLYYCEPVRSLVWQFPQKEIVGAIRLGFPRGEAVERSETDEECGQKF